MGGGASVDKYKDNGKAQLYEKSVVRLQAQSRGATVRGKFGIKPSSENEMGFVQKADSSFQLSFPINFEKSSPESLSIDVKGMKLLPLKRMENDQEVKGGDLYIEDVKLNEDENVLSLSIGGANLDALDRGVLGVGYSSDPFLRIKTIDDHGGTVVYQSEVITNELTPSWESFEVDFVRLCNKQKDVKFRIECWDCDRQSSQSDNVLMKGFLPSWKDGVTKHKKRTSYGPDDLIGSIEVTVEELQAQLHYEVPPALNILIYIVGTRGDVQPFIAFSQALQKDGHRVRLATHAMYRKFVMDQGVEFYPLAGDPTKLSETMVKQGGRIVPITVEEYKSSQENLKMIEEIIYSTWPAAHEPDPDGKGEGMPGEPFLAELIVANPPAYGHVHVAEKLGVPLHMFFPQPWVMTKRYPHPLANLSYGSGSSSKNYFSYLAIERMMWTGTGNIINEWRQEVLGLEKLSSAPAAAGLLHSIPFAHMWSPSICPKCPDWPPQVSVTGGFYLPAASTWDDPPQDLVDFLDAGSAPIFIGFGSMVINKPQKLLKMIFEAAEKNGNDRILIQSGWTKFAEALAPDESFPPNIFHLGPAPHGWLMPRMGAVVHHGGAGTVAAGLRAGKPTFVCPFFGDQYFWGQLMFDREVGPKPCPVRNLTASKLSEAFATLRDEKIVENALKMAQEISKEDGITGGIKTLYRCLQGLPKNSAGKPIKDWGEHQEHLESTTSSFVNFTIRNMRVV